MRPLKNLIGACIACAVLSAPAAAETTCTDDNGCAKDEHCLKLPCATTPCAPGTECKPAPCPDEGTCVANGPGSTCTEDANCPGGFVCEVVGASGCSAPGCEPGGECPPAPPCDPEEIKACVPAPCENDAQCGDGLSCITFVQQDCPDAAPAACAPGMECPPPPPAPACQETSRSLCAPPYVAPCQVATDCGDGFACQPQEQCSCSGGAAKPMPDPDPDGGAPPPPEDPPEEQCSCTPSGENVCVPNEIACTGDGAGVCPTGWTCEAEANVATCAAPPPGAEPADYACPPPSAPTFHCVPPGWNDWGWGGGLGSAGANYSDAVARATGAESATPQAPPSPSAQLTDRGCAVAGGDPSAVLLWLLVLGLLWFRCRSPR